MKIDIITFHNTSNFGATLQCTALFNYLKGKGHDVEVINYLPSYVVDKKSVTKELKKVSTSGNKIKAILKGMAYIAYAGKVIKRDRRFEAFIGENLKLSRVYHTCKELQADPPVADLYICGSDQIWNSTLTGGTPDKAFFLRFVRGKKKASYGASMGEFYVEENGEELKRLTKDYIGISVRESSMAPRLSKVIGRNVEAVLDCTLLLDRQDYCAMEKDYPCGKTPYLLLYNMQRSEISNRIAKKIAREKKLKIINISPNPFVRCKGARNRIDIGPGEFLTLFRNAEYVVTNSFHGTVFSILYGKQFTSIPHSTRSGRVVDLLGMLGLKDRMTESADQIDRNMIDFEEVHERLRECRRASNEYLNRILSGAGE